MASFASRACYGLLATLRLFVEPEKAQTEMQRIFFPQSYSRMLDAPIVAASPAECLNVFEECDYPRVDVTISKSTSVRDHTTAYAEATPAEATGAEATGAEATGAEATGAEATGAEATGAESSDAWMTSSSHQATKTVTVTQFEAVETTNIVHSISPRTFRLDLHRPISTKSANTTTSTGPNSKTHGVAAWFTHLMWSAWSTAIFALTLGLLGFVVGSCYVAAPASIQLRDKQRRTYLGELVASYENELDSRDNSEEWQSKVLSIADDENHYIRGALKSLSRNYRRMREEQRNSYAQQQIDNLRARNKTLGIKGVDLTERLDRATARITELETDRPVLVPRPTQYSRIVQYKVALETADRDLAGMSRAVFGRESLPGAFG